MGSGLIRKPANWEGAVSGWTPFLPFTTRKAETAQLRLRIEFIRALPPDQAEHVDDAAGVKSEAIKVELERRMQVWSRRWFPGIDSPLDYCITLIFVLFISSCCVLPVRLILTPFLIGPLWIMANWISDIRRRLSMGHRLRHEQCVACGYSLAGLTGHALGVAATHRIAVIQRCPECGYQLPLLPPSPWVKKTRREDR